MAVLLPAGRATHVHNKVHIVVEEGSDIEAEYNSSRVSHTGQFFFEDSLLDTIYALYPYRSAICTDCISKFKVISKIAHGQHISSRNAANRSMRHSRLKETCGCSRHTAGGSTGRTALADDSIFASSDDYTQIFTINYVDSNDISAGLVASVTAVVDPTTTAAATNSGMGGDPLNLVPGP